MIIYFSGAGNSRYVAKELAARLGDKALAIGRMTNVTMIAAKAQKRLILVFPIYSWGVPPIMHDFAKEWSKARKGQDAEVFAVCTCGDDTGNAPKMLRKVLNRSGAKLTGFMSVQMPNTYVLLPGFDVDTEDVAIGKLRKSAARIDEVAEKIKGWESVFDYVPGSVPGLKSGIVFPLFKRWGIKPSKFFTTDACNSCGTCAKACPVGNIVMDKSIPRRPQWGNDCTSCLACYHACPQNAVQYGNATKGKGQYSLLMTLVKGKLKSKNG